MKRDTLYTVSKHNKNLFDWGGLAGSTDPEKIKEYQQSTNLFGISKIDNPFSKGNMQGGLSAMAGTDIGKGVLAGISGVASSGIQSLIGGGYNSGIGNTVGSLGRTVGSAISQFNPLLGTAVNIGTGVLGGGINAVIGTKVNQGALNAANANIAALNNFTSNAATFDAVEGPTAFGNVGKIYSGGLAKKGWAANQNATMQQRMNDALAFADRSVYDNIETLKSNQLNNALANYTAYGGPIHIKPENRGKFTALKERTGHSASWFKEHGTPAQKKMATFAINAAKWHGLGGNMFDLGGHPLFGKGGYKAWKKKAEEYKGLNVDKDNTYDYEGWYNENPQVAWDLLNDSPEAHFDDSYKTVYHPTFSTYSKYSGVVHPKFNPQGLTGGTWSDDGHVFTMSPDGYKGPVGMDERRQYLEDAEDNGVVMREADGSLPVYDGDAWGGVLPNIQIVYNRKSYGGPLVKEANRYDLGGDGEGFTYYNEGNRTSPVIKKGSDTVWNPIDLNGVASPVAVYDRSSRPSYPTSFGDINMVTQWDENGWPHRYEVYEPNYTLDANKDNINYSPSTWVENQNTAKETLKGIGTGLATVAGATAGALTAPAWGPLLLTPGSSFWMHPLTKAVVAGEVGGNAVNLASNLVTGNDWDTNVGNLVKAATKEVNSWAVGDKDAKGWNPNSTWWGRLMTDLSNFGYWGPNAVERAVLKGSEAVGKAATLYNSPLTGEWTRIGGREYRFSPNSVGMNGRPIESREIRDWGSMDMGKMRSIFEDYAKSLTQFKGNKLPSIEYNPSGVLIDYNNLVTDDFVDYLSKQTGRTIRRVPIKDTEHGKIYNEGFAFVDDEGKEIAHIAGDREAGKNVWVGSSFVSPEFRHQGLGKQMYFDFNNHVFNTYGTTLHSSPYQRVGSTGAGMSPSNRLWKSLREKGLASFEGEGLNRYDVMAEPSKITTAYRTSNKMKAHGGPLVREANKYDAGGDFLNTFSEDPLKAATQYIQSLDALDAEKEAQAEAAAREQAYQDMQTRLLNAETQNQGLQSLLNNQALSIKALQDAQKEAASVQPVQTNQDNWQGQLLNESRAITGEDDYSRLIPFIMDHEGFSSKAYTLKGEKHPSIGYGFYEFYPGTTRRIQPGDTMTKEEAAKGIGTVLSTIDKELSKKVPNWDILTTNQRDALRDLAYGTGPWGAHFKKGSRLFKALENKDWEAASKELTSKSASLRKYDKYLAKISKRRQDMWNNGVYSMKAFGGELGTNGTDFSNGLLEVNAGGSHEDNPFSGVQMGFDNQGVPNFVEEGETVFNNYVFSNRMAVPSFMSKQLGLGGSTKGKPITFAEASKKLAEASKERPNSPIDKDGLQASLGKLAQIQETERAKLQAEEENAKAAMQELMALGGNLKNKPVGNMFAKGTEELYNNPSWSRISEADPVVPVPNTGGWNLGNYSWLRKDYEPSKTSGFIPYNRQMLPSKVNKIEASDNFRNWTNYVTNNWDKPDVQNYLRELDKVAGGNHLFDVNGNPVAGAQEYYRRQRGLGDNGNHLWGYYHLTPDYIEAANDTPSGPILGPVVNTDSEQLHWGFPDGNWKSYFDAAREAGYNGLPERDWLGNPTGSGKEPIYVGIDGVEHPEYTNTEIVKASNAAKASNTAGKKQGEEINSNDDTPKTYDTWMRYAPAVGAGIMSLTDLLGLTNRPDYTYANKLEAAANRAGYVPNISFDPIGDYMRYTPLDRLFYANQLQANSRATDRNLMNVSGGNRGTAAAGMLANSYATQQGLGNLYRQAEEYNLAQREKVADFNRATNMFNSQMGLEAAMANARFRQGALSAQLQGLAQAAALRDAIDQRIGASRSANITNLLTSLGNIGRENFAMNQINWDRSRRYKGDLSGRSRYDAPKSKKNV